MTERKFYQTLEFWVSIIIIVLLASNIGISFLKPDWNTKIGLFISLNASLLGGLCTLISVSISNKYYYKEKITGLHSQQLDTIYRWIQLLKFLLDEFNVNKKIYDEYSKSSTVTFAFQSIVWDECKKEFMDIFIREGIKNHLPELQYLYSQMKFSNNVITPSSAKVFGDNYENLVEGIKTTLKIYEATEFDFEMYTIKETINL